MADKGRKQASSRTDTRRFYYADERTPDGAPVYSAIDGEAHAKMYWQLAIGDEQGPWQATFVKGVGYRDFSRSAAL